MNKPLWVTEIRAIDPETGELKTWCGPNVPGITAKDAQLWCKRNKGYLKVIGRLVSEIPADEETHEPDWDNQVDYDSWKN